MRSIYEFIFVRKIIEGIFYKKHQKHMDTGSNYSFSDYCGEVLAAE